MRAPLAVLSVGAALTLWACGGTDTPNLFADPPPDAGKPAVDNGDAGNLVTGPEAGSLAPPAVCDPQSTASFAPSWQQPEAWKQGACTATQIQGFHTACLTPPIAKTACDAFVQANSNCAACLQSQETDATSAAIVWHQQMHYWTVNVAGCIAQATGDTSASGCGATYAAAIACRQSSCNACWQAAQSTSATFQQFSDCESQAGTTTCQTYAQAVPDKCGILSSGPAAVCMPKTSATAADAYAQIAPLFCGQ